MNRSGYTDDGDDQWALICWRGAVASSIRGARGQALLRELLAALDAMPDKRLIAEELSDRNGGYCALGALGAARGLPVESFDPHDYGALAKAFGVAAPLIREIEFENDDGFSYWNESAQEDIERERRRWGRVREWVKSQIKPETL